MYSFSKHEINKCILQSENQEPLALSPPGSIQASVYGCHSVKQHLRIFVLTRAFTTSRKSNNATIHTNLLIRNLEN